MQRVECPVCKREGRLMWKETKTFSKGKMYTYRKLYVYHGKGTRKPWCYMKPEHLEALGVTTQKTTQSTTQNATQNENCNLRLFSENIVDGAGLIPNRVQVATCVQ